MALPYATENQLKLLEQKTKSELDKKTANVNLTADTLEDMNALVTQGRVTDGQICYCKEDKKLYVLKDGKWEKVGGGESAEDLPVVELTEETTSVTDETIREKILENVNNNKYLICKLKMTLLVPIEILITRDTKITSNDNTINTTYSVISNLDLGIVSSTVNFILIINKDNTIVVKYSDFGYVKGNHISLAENNIKSTGIGVTADFGDTDYINGTTFYFDTINGNKIYHTADYEIIDHTIPETKSISIFGNHNILVPETSTDTSILPCTTSDNGKVLSVVNGSAKWSAPESGSSTIIRKW